MKKSTVISLTIIGLIIAALVFVLVTKKADAPASNNETDDKTSQSVSSAEENTANEPASSNGQYVEYDEAKLTDSENENYLFFHAPWCPQCRAIEASIYNGGKIPEDVTIYKIDYDSNQALRQKYGVTLQTTFVKVDNQGNFIDKYVAYNTPSIESVVENFIDK